MKEENWKQKYLELEKDYNEMEHRFACFLQHATATMSKTNYTLDSMIEEFNRHETERFRDFLKDIINDYCPEDKIFSPREDPTDD